MPFQLDLDSFVIRDELRESMVTYHPEYVDWTEAEQLLNSMHSVAWQAEAPIIFGKPRLARRKTCAFGDPGIVYRYSGMRKEAAPWPDFLVGILNRLRHDTGHALNFCLANLYPDGKAGIGPHADDESDIVAGSPIVCISLGATRDFVFYQDDLLATSVKLSHGSAVAMWLRTQEHYKHALPARNSVKMPRVSLTFREMVIK